MRKPLLLWLYGTAFLVLCMVALGGITRLEGAGLSMVTWKPLRGMLPPLTLGDWQALFKAYKTSPEFEKINFMFTLEDFKSIFWLEFLHRLLGRFVGLFFFVPLLFFWVKGALTPLLKRRALLCLLLGALQGLMGWWMVKSGLKDNPHVSPYRLAAHLGLALLLYGTLLWTAFSLHCSSAKPDAKTHRGLCRAVLLLCCTIFYGALVAGLKAGLLYNSFPLMGGHLLPGEAWSMTPLYKNIFENPVLVQFIHRWLATATALFILWTTLRHKTPLSSWIQILVALQFLLGVLTLLYCVPTLWAVCHQVTAALLLGVLLRALFQSGKRYDKKYLSSF